MPNSNCLEGMRCPKCGSEGPFRMAVTAMAMVHDDGTDNFSNVVWNDDSYCACMDCNYLGVVSQFYACRHVVEDLIRRGMSRCQCDDCHSNWDVENLSGCVDNIWPDIPNLLERLDPGGIVPVAECPNCGALVYPAKDGEELQP